MMQRGDIAGAVIQLKNAVQSDPANAPAHYELGRALTAAGDLATAERQLNAAAGAGYDGDQIDAALAEVFLKQERYGDLLDQLKDGNRPAEIEARIRMARGEAALALQRAPIAEREFTSAMTLLPNPAEAEAAVARARVAQNDVRGAAEFLDRAVADDAHLVEAWILLGRARAALGDHAAARKALDRAIELAPGSAEAHFSRAEITIDVDETQAAADVAAVLGKTRSARAYLLDAIIKARHQKWREAEAALLKIKQPEALPRSLLVLARVNLAQGQLERAESNITHYVALVPDDPAGIGIMAVVLTQRGKPRDAIGALNKALASHPDSLALLGALSDAYAKNGQRAEAAATLDRIAAVAPRDAKTRLQIAAQYLASGRPAEALDDLALAQASEAPSVETMTLAAEAMLAAGKLDEAAAAADDLILRAPGDPAGEVLRGVIALQKEGFEAARSHFEKALAINPDLPQAAIDLAQTYRTERRFDEARGVYDRALKRNAKSIALLVARADVEFADAKPADGISWLERARAADSQAVEPRLRLVGAYIEKNAAKALPVARELEKIAPKDPQAIAALAEAQLANNDRQTAISSFERVVEMTGQSLPAVSRLAEVLLLDGKAPAAYRLMQKAIETKPDDPRLQEAFVAVARKADMIAAGLELARDLGKRDPSDAAIDELAGQLLEADNQYDAAVGAYSAGLSKATSGRPARRLAQAQLRANAPDAARATLAGWLEKQPDDRESRLMLAGLLARQQNGAEAIAQFERLVAEKADDPIALNELALLYQRTGDGRARAAAEKAFVVAARSPIIGDTLGWILLQEGETARATMLIRQAAEARPASPVLRYHLAVALDKSGEREDAKRLLGELLQSNAQFSDRAAAEKLYAQLGG